MSQRVAALEAQIATLTHTVAQLSAMVASDHQGLIEKIKAVINTTPPPPVSTPVVSSSVTGVTATSSSSDSTAVLAATPVKISAPVAVSSASPFAHKWCYATYQPQAIPVSETPVISSSHQVGVGRDDHFIQILHEGMYAIRLDGLVKHSGVNSLAELLLVVNGKVYETITIPLLGPVGSSYGMVSASYIKHMQADDKVSVTNGNTTISIERLSISVTKY